MWGLGVRGCRHSTPAGVYRGVCLQGVFLRALRRDLQVALLQVSCECPKGVGKGRTSRWVSQVPEASP